MLKDLGISAIWVRRFLCYCSVTLAVSYYSCWTS